MQSVSPKLQTLYHFSYLWIPKWWRGYKVMMTFTPKVQTLQHFSARRIQKKVEGLNIYAISQHESANITALQQPMDSNVVEGL